MRPAAQMVLCLSDTLVGRWWLANSVTEYINRSPCNISLILYLNYMLTWIVCVLFSSVRAMTSIYSQAWGLECFLSSFSFFHILNCLERSCLYSEDLSTKALRSRQRLFPGNFRTNRLAAG